MKKQIKSQEDEKYKSSEYEYKAIGVNLSSNEDEKNEDKKYVIYNLSIYLPFTILNI